MAMGEFVRLLGFLAGTLVFFVLTGVDICRALKKGNHWVPGHALVLSALTIQIMDFVEKQINGLLLDSKTLEDEVRRNNFIMINSSRVMICVLVALFLPEMARVSYEEKWTKIAAVGLSVFTDIFSELLTAYRRFADSLNRVSLTSFMVSDVLISVSLLWLILLLISATIASKGIRNITIQKIPLILAEPDVADYWKGIENQVLKSWIVVCVCYPESMIAKSVLASSAALVVTICILSSVVEWIVQGPNKPIPAGADSWLILIITILEVVFILIGWVVLSWRSLTSVHYYGRWKEKSWVAWFNQFSVEDFWTGHIREKLREEESKHHFRIDSFWTKHVEAKESKTKLRDAGRFSAIEKRKYLLKFVLWLQFIVVFFSKVSWFLIEVMFYNRVAQKIASVVFPYHNKEVRTHFEAHYEAILENVTIIGETPWSVFATNRKQLKQATRLAEDGYKDGKEDCNRLISFLKCKTSSPLRTVKMLPPLRVGVRGCLDFHRATEYEPGFLKFLCKRDPVDQLEEEKIFLYMREGSWSWKLTAISLINIIVSLSPPCGLDSLNAYFEAWQLMDLVDEWDPETDCLLSKAADTEFNTLVGRICRSDSKESYLTTITMDQVAAKITQLAETKRKSLENRRDENHEQLTPVDREKLAGGIALYKLCKGMDFSSGNFIELKSELESSLKEIIIACIQRVGTALVDNCRKWAQDLKEEKEQKLLKAIYIAGKSRGLVEALGWNSHIDPTTEELSMV